MGDKFEETEIMICDCNSIEHQAKFYYWKEDNYDVLGILIHLMTHRSIFKRIWYAIKYIFGYKSRFGAWDEFLMSENNRDDLKKFLNEKVK